MSAPTRGAVVGALAVLLLAGCTADEAPPQPEPTSDPTPDADTDEADDWTVESLGAAILEEDLVEGVEPVATATGTVTSIGGEWEVQVDVLSVTADEDGTDLTYVLRSPDGVVADGDRHAWGDGRKIYNDTRSIAILDEEGEARLQPYTGYTSFDRDSQAFCACSSMPSSVGEGDVLGALLPPLDPATTSVTVEFPGFEPLTDVPVTRR